MSIHHVQILRLPMCEVSDGKATTGGCVDQGIMKERTVIKGFAFAFASRRGKTSCYVLNCCGLDNNFIGSSTYPQRKHGDRSAG